MKIIATLLLLTICAVPAFAKRDPLTKKEVDELREVTQDPEKRIALLVKYAKARMLAIQQVQADPKIADRPQQIHDLLEDFNTLHDELDDNLDMYTRRKDDFRKALKIAIEAYSEWQVQLRTLKESFRPEELKQFSFALDTAFENVNAGADITRELLAEQEQAKKKKDEKKPKASDRE
jgi:hypothetical protein